VTVQGLRPTLYLSAAEVICGLIFKYLRAVSGVASGITILGLYLAHSVARLVSTYLARVWACKYTSRPNLDVGPGAIQAAIVHAGRREGIVSGIGDRMRYLAWPTPWLGL
jgi:hypothetical protein